MKCLGDIEQENIGIRGISNYGPIACSQSSQAILKRTLNAGTYYAVSSAITWEDVVVLNITGQDPGLIAGNTLQNPIDAGTYSAGFTYSDTRNTLDFTDEYTSRPMADVFHKFSITSPMTGVLNSNLKKHGIDLPHSQYSVMRVLFDEDGISQAEIATRLHKDAAVVKRSIDNLENKNLIVRKPASLCKYSISLSETGKNMQPEIMRIAAQSMEEILEDISGKDFEALTGLLNRIYTSNTKRDEKAKRQRD